MYIHTAVPRFRLDRSFLQHYYLKQTQLNKKNSTTLGSEENLLIPVVYKDARGCDSLNLHIYIH